MNLKAIGNRIKSARELAQMTQGELAEKTHLSPTHISCIERGIKPPKLDTFINIANTLSVSTDSLLQDVLEQSEDSSADLISAIHNLPEQEQRRIAHIIHAFSETV